MSARKLTEQEELTWEKATIQGAMKAPVFTDALSMVIPYYSDDVNIACIDEHWRIALGDDFFKLTNKQQAFVACHEACHVLNLHFTRAIAAHQSDGMSSRLSQDIEIDQQFTGIEGLDMPSMYPMPNDYNVPKYHTMEEYYPIIHGNGNGESSAASQSSNNSTASSNANSANNSSANNNDDNSNNSKDNNKSSSNDSDSKNSNRTGTGTGTGSNSKSDKTGSKQHSKSKPRGCADDNPDKLSHEADNAGIMKLSTANIANTMKSTHERAITESKKYGKGSANGRIIEWLDAGMRPPKTDWRDILRRIVSNVKTVKSYQAIDRSFNKVNKRAAAFMPDVIIPGYTSFSPQVMMALDTSGSMASNEIHSALMEAQGVINSGLGKGCFKVFCIDTEMKNVQPVDDITKLNITGRGGTDMMPAFKYIRELPMHSKPDMFILATDGFVPWDSCKKWLPDWNCVLVLLITSDDGLEQIPQWLHDASIVISITPDERLGRSTARPHGFGSHN